MRSHLELKTGQSFSSKILNDLVIPHSKNQTYRWFYLIFGFTDYCPLPIFDNTVYVILDTLVNFTKTSSKLLHSMIFTYLVLRLDTLH